MFEPRTEHRELGFLETIRFRCFKLLYDTMFSFMVHDASWQDPLFKLIAPKAHCLILSFGLGSVWVARNLALRFPEATIIGADHDQNAIERIHRSLVRRTLSNLSVVKAPQYGRIPFSANSFDKVVLVLALHHRPTDEKLSVAKEMLRVLRHGGTLYVAAYDKPNVSSERAILLVTRYLSGPTAADSHLDGSWIELLAKAGFTNVRRKSSYSVGAARIAMVKARKP